MNEYKIEIKNSVGKSIKSLPKDMQDRIRVAINELKTNPRPYGYTKLSDEEEKYRIRVGSYRIIYKIEDKNLIVCVLKVGDRKDIYKDI